MQRTLNTHALCFRTVQWDARKIVRAYHVHRCIRKPLCALPGPLWQCPLTSLSLRVSAASRVTGRAIIFPRPQLQKVPHVGIEQAEMQTAASGLDKKHCATLVLGRRELVFISPTHLPTIGKFANKRKCKVVHFTLPLLQSFVQQTEASRPRSQTCANKRSSPELETMKPNA